MKEKVIGIYKITNLINNKVYIGSSINIKKRKKKHFYDLKKNNHSNSHLQNSFNQYGESAFSFDIIEYIHIKNKQLILDKEDYYIALYKSTSRTNGYNLREVAGSNLGYKWSEESKLRIKGRVISEDQKNKLRACNLGKKLSSETKLKIGLASKARGSGFKGKRHNEESLRKISIASKRNKGKKLSDKHKEKLSIAHKGKKLSYEHREKLRNLNLGRTLSQETKKLISERVRGKGGKLTEALVREIKNIIRENYSNKYISQYYNISPSTVSDIKYGRTWIHVS
ncbi:hypothetical protein Elgi_38830 [Paenibacillus elgii]|uniref:NUMOD3 domain-containing DNA-binding protein n=1 Tax=Paenibacillus elgii TaxID=189691 RepID=UPI002D7D8093|nr:hypothetical protein Elgi_38830 [Paenibacillus elgii]